MLIGITDSPRGTDRRLARHFEGSHFFTCYDLRSPIKDALMALYGHRLADYTEKSKASHIIPFTKDGSTYPQLEDNMERFLKATAGKDALYAHLESVLLNSANQGADMVVTGLTLGDAPWFAAQGGTVVVVDDALESPPVVPAAVPHFVFYNDMLNVDEFLVAADTMLDKAKRKFLNSVQRG